MKSNIASSGQDFREYQTFCCEPHVANKTALLVDVVRQRFDYRA